MSHLHFYSFAPSVEIGSDMSEHNQRRHWMAASYHYKTNADRLPGFIRKPEPSGSSPIRRF